MRLADFAIGRKFRFSDRTWRCTDIGTRVVVAIRVDHVDVGGIPTVRSKTLTHAEAEMEGWFNGPPYAVLESVFDECDLEGCIPYDQVSESPDETSP